MYILVFKHTRPWSGLTFFDWRTLVQSHLDENFFNKGKLLALNVSYSDDQLTMTTEYVFDSKESAIEYTFDPVIADAREQKRIYDEFYDIVVEFPEIFESLGIQ